MGTRSRIMFPNPVHEPSVHRAWESLVLGRNTTTDSVRDLVDHSWQRCLQAQVDPNRAQGPDPVSSDALATLHDQQHDMLSASAPVMACARDYLAETGSIMILADASGTILASEGDYGAKDKASSIHLMPGAQWSEAACGTNAIGTALEIGEPVQIHSAEHFCAGIKRWTCAATVVRHPTDGDILGALDVSGLSSTFHKQSLALAVTTAKRIEARLATAEMERRYRLLDASIRHWHELGEDGAVLFDRRGTPIKANESAAKAIANAGGNAQWLRNMTRVPALSQWQLGSWDATRLPPWMRSDWLHPILVQGHWIGTMLIVPQPRSLRVAKLGPAATPASTCKEGDAFDHLIYGPGPMQDVVRKARQLASARTPVLLHGETGVGKEEFARGLHGGRIGAYVALNCGGLARDLLASELFGHGEGAFTGARKGGMAGKVEAAHGGTLFLDEIGEMPLEMQPMLLRVLEQGEVYRLGETTPRKVDFRLVAATHRKLREEVTAGRFRMDLYYRIAVTTLQIPPLRERPEDVLRLAQHYLQRFRLESGHAVERLPDAVLACLQAYDWPGNIRELRNVMEAAVLLSAGAPLTVEELPQELQSATSGSHTAPAGSSDAVGSTTLDDAGQDAIRRAIQAEKGNLTRAARRLGIAKSTLYLKLRSYGMTRESVLPPNAPPPGPP